MYVVDTTKFVDKVPNYKSTTPVRAGISINLYPDTLNLEDHIRLSFNYLKGCLDRNWNFLPYFRTYFYPEPKFEHEWPDFGDLTARFLDAFILARCMTGSDEGLKEEEELGKLLISYFSEGDGLSYRPKTDWSGHDALMFDQGRVLMALTTWYLDKKEKRIKAITNKMIEGLLSIVIKESSFYRIPYHVYPLSGWDKNYNGGRLATGPADPVYDAGVWISPLIRYYQETGFDKALDLAEGIINWIIYASGSFHFESGVFKGHFHSHMTTVAGIIRYAGFKKDLEKLEWAKRVFDYAMSLGSKFGWFPEDVQYDTACETCGITDMVDCAILLAKIKYPELWNVAERIVRNHLVETQLRDILWIPEDSEKIDDRKYSYKDIAKRSLGAFAGWSDPNDYIGRHCGYGKRKFFLGQNCCGPAGVHGLYLIWSNIVIKKDDIIMVNLLINRNTKWVKVLSFIPYEGRVEIKIKEAPKLKVRIPDWVERTRIEVKVNGDIRHEFQWEESYVSLQGLRKMDLVSILFPMVNTIITESIGGGNFTTYWKGDTVIEISPPGEIVPLYKRWYYSFSGAELPLKELNYNSSAGNIEW